MTPDIKRRPGDRQRPIYDAQGHAVASLTAARTAWEGALLAECERGHVYVLPNDVTQWTTVEAGCPRCRVLGLPARTSLRAQRSAGVDRDDP
jgi:hypothetical protein